MITQTTISIEREFNFHLSVACNNHFVKAFWLFKRWVSSGFDDKSFVNELCSFIEKYATLHNRDVFITKHHIENLLGKMVCSNRILSNFYREIFFDKKVTHINTFSLLNHIQAIEDVDYMPTFFDKVFQ